MSSGNTKMYAVLAVILVLAAGAVGVVLLNQPTATGPSITLVAFDGTQRNVTLSEMLGMETIERYGSYQNSYGNVRGKGNYTGVLMSDLIELIGGMEVDQIITVIAEDDYQQNFTYPNLYPNTTQYAIQGDFILAFSLNGTVIPDFEEGPRLMFLPEDGYYSNNDAALTIDSQFYTGSAGPKLVSTVAKIMIAETPAPPPDALFINRGSTTLAYSLAEVMAMPSLSGNGGYMKSSGTLVGPSAYTGVTVQYLLSLVGEPLVNSSIEAIATDLYTTYYNMTQIEGWYPAYNVTTGVGVSVGIKFFTMLLAYERDGLLLTDDGPFRIVLLNEDGYFSDGHFWNKMVANITIVDSVESWTLVLDGVDPYNMTHDTYYSLASCEHHRIEISTEGHTYWGVALWVLVAAMDGGDDVHYTFNVTLAIAGYNVTLYDSLGANVTYTAAQLAQNGSIIVAGWIDGLLPNAPTWPLILVTPDGALLSNIVRIEMFLY